MELKDNSSGVESLTAKVSIAPLWNWKKLGLLSVSGGKSFNRTFMELKGGFALLPYPGSMVSIAPLWNWKRWWPDRRRPVPRFNRTFMELKGPFFYRIFITLTFQSHLYGIESSKQMETYQHQPKFQSHLYGIESFNDVVSSTLITVSIAPLWNWKTIQSASKGFALSFNRTFMELKG